MGIDVSEQCWIYLYLCAEHQDRSFQRSARDKCKEIVLYAFISHVLLLLSLNNDFCFFYLSYKTELIREQHYKRNTFSEVSIKSILRSVCIGYYEKFW